MNFKIGFSFLIIVVLYFYPLKSMGFKTSLNFSGEICPFEKEEYFIKYLNQKRLIENILKREPIISKRISIFFPIVSAILNHYQIPDDFKYLMLEESFLINQSSPKGAGGYWQIMGKTGREFGLKVLDRNDDRSSIIKSTNMVCWYLRKLYKIFGSWTLTAAAYNEGQGRLAKQIEKENCRNYYSLKLNRETSNYVYKILAFKYSLIK